MSVGPRHGMVLVTGKGGVGKSMVAAASALQLARRGASVLLVELGERSFYGPLLKLDVGYERVTWRENVAIERWDMESALRELLAHYLLMSKAVADRILQNTSMKALTGAAPNLSELAILGKLTASTRQRWYKRQVDVVVVDAYATGQFMTLLRAPRGLAEAVASGPMGRQSRAIVDQLRDPAITEYRLVTLPEELPVAEACELAAAIHEEVGMAPRLYCNKLVRVPPELKRAKIDAGDAAYPFALRMRRTVARQTGSLQRLRAARHAGLTELPFVTSLDPLAVLNELADALDAGERLVR